MGERVKDGLITCIVKMFAEAAMIKVTESIRELSDPIVVYVEGKKPKKEADKQLDIIEEMTLKEYYGIEKKDFWK